MIKFLKKMLLTGAGLLILTSIGSTANIVPNSNIHASHVSKLISQRNNDNKKSVYYKNQAKKLNIEIKRLTNHTHHKITNRIKVSSLSAKNRKAYYTGLADGGNATNDDTWYNYISLPIIHKHLLNNKYYEIGYHIAYMDNDQNKTYIKKYSSKQLRNIEKQAKDLGKSAIEQGNSNVRE